MASIKPMRVTRHIVVGGEIVYTDSTVVQACNEAEAIEYANDVMDRVTSLGDAEPLTPEEQKEYYMNKYPRRKLH